MRPIRDGQAREKVAAAKSAVVSRWAEIREQNEAAIKAAAEGGEEGGEESLLDRYMPTPQIAAVAVMALLAAGVILGAVTDQLAQSASAPVVMLGEPASAPEEEPAPEETETEYIEEEGPPGAVVSEAPLPAQEEVFEEPYEGGEEPPATELPELPEEAVLPPVSHMFVIVLGEHGYETAFGKTATAPFMKQLTEKGELLQNYYSVAQGGLANQIALLSGQGPTAQTAAGCPEYGDITPGTVDPATVGSTEAVTGTGCVYPATTATLPSQLVAAGSTWKAYVEGENGAAAGGTCGPGRNPMAYFHALLDNGECSTANAGLEQLAADLKGTEVPSLSYIVPNACHDGAEAPCAPGQPGGLAGAESFLQTVVPQIESSPSFAVGGMIAITFAAAPQTGPEADPSSCCATPEYPNLKDPSAPPPAPAGGPVKPTGGGGRVGMLLISPYVLPGSVNETYYNHFSFLRSLEELFGQTPIGYAAEPAIVGFDETVYNRIES